MSVQEEILGGLACLVDCEVYGTVPRHGRWFSHLRHRGSIVRVLTLRWRLIDPLLAPRAHTPYVTPKGRADLHTLRSTWFLSANISFLPISFDRLTIPSPLVILHRSVNHASVRFIEDEKRYFQSRLVGFWSQEETFIQREGKKKEELILWRMNASRSRCT